MMQNETKPDRPKNHKTLSTFFAGAAVVGLIGTVFLTANMYVRTVGLSDQVEVLKSAKATLELEIARHESDRRTKVEELKKLSEDYTKLSSEHSSLVSGVTSEKKTLADLRAEVVKLQNAEKTLLESRSTLEADVTNLTKNRSDLAEEIRRMEDHREELRPMELRHKTLTIDLRDSQARHDDLSKRLLSLQERMKEANERYAKLQNDYAALQEERSKIRLEISTVKSDLQRSAAEKNRVNSSLADMKKSLNDVESRLESKAKELASLEASLSRADAQLKRVMDSQLVTGEFSKRMTDIESLVRKYSDGSEKLDSVVAEIRTKQTDFGNAAENVKAQAAKIADVASRLEAEASQTGEVRASLARKDEEFKTLLQLVTRYAANADRFEKEAENLQRQNTVLAESVKAASDMLDRLNDSVLKGEERGKLVTDTNRRLEQAGVQATAVGQKLSDVLADVTKTVEALKAQEVAITDTGRRILTECEKLATASRALTDSVKRSEITQKTLADADAKRRQLIGILDRYAEMAARFEQTLKSIADSSEVLTGSVRNIQNDASAVGSIIPVLRDIREAASEARETAERLKRDATEPVTMPMSEPQPEPLPAAADNNQP